jgi:chromosome partitioning protein
MIITITNFKGGVAKSTSAVHLAAYLNEYQPCLLVDGDPNKSVSAWAKRGKLPFQVCDEREAIRFGREYKNIVIDTPARPSTEDLRALAGGCDRMIIPATADLLSLDALMQITENLRALKCEHFRILLTMAPPRPNRDAEEARQLLTEAGLPVLKATIPRLIAFQRAVMQGTTIREVKDQRAGDGWLAYAEAGKEIYGQE